MTGGGLSALTQREKEILHQMARGLSCRGISCVLAISEFTVKTHRRNMLAKLGCRNAAQLLEHARQAHVLSRPGRSRGIDALSRRENEVMAFVVRGFTSKQISRQLGIADRTVRKHRENLLRKLKLRSIAQLVANAP